MASEILAVPDEHLAETVAIIRIGLAHAQRVTPEVAEALSDWCTEIVEYLNG